MNRNWLEDFDHENGTYQNTCVKCQATFVGHKRRVVCKICTDLATAQAEVERLTECLNEVKRITYGHGCQSLQPFCASCSAYDIATNGLTDLTACIDRVSRNKDYWKEGELEEFRHGGKDAK